jgi:hypothetical protein
VIALPPLDVGGVRVTVAVSSPTVAINDVGAPGTVAAITAIDTVEVSEIPIAFVAVATYLYSVPFVSPLTVQLVAGAFTVHDLFGDSGLPDASSAVTVYEVIAEPPLFSGAVNETTADAFAVVAVRPVGGPGILAGITADDAAESVDVPEAFVAVVSNLYAVPFVRPEITQVVAGAFTVQDFDGDKGLPDASRAVIV